MENKCSEYIKKLRESLPLGKSFDVSERKIKIGGRDAVIFFVEGLADGKRMQWLLSFLLNMETDSVFKAQSAESFMEENLPFLSCIAETDINIIIKSIFAGLVPLAIDGFDKIILIDEREYPTRGIAEPEKEKTLRGAKDGFNESLMTNIALIRRRIRDERLIVESHTLGKITRADMAVIYMSGIADEKLIRNITEKIDALTVNTITVGEQSLIELMEGLGKPRGKKIKKLRWLNPFPKARYTQRPDVVAAHLTEGKIAILLDNSPTAILIPTGIFDFTQDVDDYYFPAMTGNYFRLMRIANFFLILFLTPVYMLIVKGNMPIFDFMKFMVPPSGYAIPLFWQFLILEVSVDALKLASLNTPNSLGMSLSVIGALILGDFAVQSGWFIPQTILCMAVVALASFTQPSMELQYGMKFIRVLILIGAETLGIYGACAGVLAGFLVIATTKTVAGTSYIYPLIPFDKTAMKRLVFRTRTGKEKL